MNAIKKNGKYHNLQFIRMEMGFNRIKGMS
jgi:hypothetical protein